MSFWTVFCPFTPYGPRKSIFLKNGKSTWRYYPFTSINDSHIMYGSSDMDSNRQNFFDILDHFLPFYPKTQNFEKMKKIPGDIIILHRCNINNNHMMYGSWDMKRNKHNFLSFWTYPPNNPKNQNLKKWNKYLEILSFYKCVP